MEIGVVWVPRGVLVCEGEFYDVTFAGANEGARDAVVEVPGFVFVLTG